MPSGALTVGCPHKKLRRVARHCAEAVDWIWHRVNVVPGNSITLLIPIQKVHLLFGVGGVHRDNDSPTNFN